MFRVGARVVEVGSVLRLSAVPRIQIRWKSQASKISAKRKDLMDQERLFLHVPGEDVPKMPKQKKRQKEQLEVESEPFVLYTAQHIQSHYELPTAATYGRGFARVINEGGLVTRRHHQLVSPRHTGGQKFVQCTLQIALPDDRSWDAKGHGITRQQAEQAAELHALCYLHKSGDLKAILAGGIVYMDPGKLRLSREANAKMEIIDYAGRHGCLPVFSYKQNSRKAFRAHVSIPDLGLDGYGRGSLAHTAILAACVSLKHAAEARHEKMGDGTLLVKDYTNLTTQSGEKFVKFYCFQQRLEFMDKVQASKAQDTGGDWITEVTVRNRAIPSDENGISLLKQNWRYISDSDAWPGVSQGEGDHERTYQGIPMMTRADSSAVGYLAAAIALKKESAYLWEKFVKEMRRGNGDILQPVGPINMGLDSDAIKIMEDTLQKTAAVETPPDLTSTSDESKEERRRGPRQLTEQDMLKKNGMLEKRLSHYETQPALTELRRLRLELPMTQHRDQVMAMINENDVCVIVGATGSGKTTQVPQMILDEQIRKGNGASCNVLCTQPRRIAAVSVARRVAEERHERMFQSVGYTVRFDSKPPEFGGSVHYVTTGVLLKQLQESQDETLEGISHIIVDEVHERDLNNDFLLVVLKNLMGDRKAVGKQPIKVILMSATINTSLFCKYFGDGFPNKMCPFIEVPGRTFPVTSHHLDDIYFELKNSYSRDEALNLYTKESQDYISRELEGPPQPLTHSKFAEDLEDDESNENKAIIDWKSKGFMGEDGQIDTAIDRDDTVTPVGIMGVTIAHLLKTTTEGSILVFVPGLQEIMALERQLNSTRPLGVDFRNNPNYKVYVLHSSLPQLQQEVFSKVGPGERKIILATNIAETAITIPDVVYVVDSSKQREMQYDRARRIASLVSAWTAKSNAQQRAGRAGRVRHGHYYTMASKARYESLEVAPTPEIMRSDLQTLCLQIKSMGVANIWRFLNRAIEPPSQNAVETAIDELQALRALNDDETITPLGRYLALLPLAPSIGKMVVLGVIFRCLDPILILACFQTSKNPFISPLDRRLEANKCRERWSMGTGSDHTAVINAFQEWRRRRRTARGMRQPDREFAYANFLHHDTLVGVSRIADQILDLLRSTGLVEAISHNTNELPNQYGSASENLYSDSQALQVALETAGFYPNVAVRRKGSPRYLRTVYENEAAIFPYSLAAPRLPDGKQYGRIREEVAAPPGTLFTFSDKTQADDHEVFLREVARTFPLAVYLFGGKSIVQGQIITVDGWIPLFVRKREKFVLRQLNNRLQQFLQRTFDRLSATRRNRRDKAPRSTRERFLEQDKVRDPLVKGIVEALESCAHSTMLKPALYDDSKERGNTELLQDLYSTSRSKRPILLGLPLAEPQSLTEDKNFYDEAEYKPHDVESRPQGFYKDADREQVLRGNVRSRLREKYLLKGPRRVMRANEFRKPRSTVLDLLQRWNKRL